MKHEATDESITDLAFDDPEAVATIRAVAGFDRCRRSAAWDDVPTREWPPHVFFRDRPTQDGRVLAELAKMPKRGRGRPRKGSRVDPHYEDFFPQYWKEQSAHGWPASSIHAAYVWDSDAEHVPQSLRCRSTLCDHKNFETRWPGQTECSLRCAEHMLGINHNAETRAAWQLALKAHAIADRRRRRREAGRPALTPHAVVSWHANRVRA